MIKKLSLLFLALLFPTITFAQISVSEDKVEEVLIKLEDADVDIIKLKTLKKWKALELSHEMKPQMDYNVVLVKYESKGQEKTVIIDQHLVPIRFDYLDKSE
ncbi:hypothetical protein [Lutimonas zeaxanthinifaciens]|uniref:hypothetical protein n=1 Tax=Lutimonas zeaxanthinifaciens TaxID=3060215 RepID=UPI00265D1CC6|nr:hypothetical protein [Lutimonas sp. YSD2104]WKK64546.1 hypothetical protein QZH61_08055 [Lutimonas sp. YSD2104]